MESYLGEIHRTGVFKFYFVSDRIKIVTNFNMTYTENHKNYSELLSIAYQKMPNLSIYEQDVNGKNLNDYYHMLNTASAELLNDQYNYVNPVALAKQAKNDESTYQIQPEFQLHYDLLGTHDDQTRLKYEGKILFNIFSYFSWMNSYCSKNIIIFINKFYYSLISF